MRKLIRFLRNILLLPNNVAKLREQSAILEEGVHLMNTIHGELRAFRQDNARLLEDHISAMLMMPENVQELRKAGLLEILRTLGEIRNLGKEQKAFLEAIEKRLRDQEPSLSRAAHRIGGQITALDLSASGGLHPAQAPREQERRVAA